VTIQGLNFGLTYVAAKNMDWYFVGSSIVNSIMIGIGLVGAFQVSSPFLAVGGKFSDNNPH